jgi:hypothetical protein
MEKNLKQEQSAITMFGKVLETTADYYKTAWFLNLRGIICKKWDKSQLICDVNDMLPLLMAKLNLKITPVHR